jgi:hypothetical protein
MRLTILLLLGMTASACHRPPTEAQLVAEISTRATHACACTSSTCAADDVDRIEALTNQLDRSRVTSPYANAMSEWTRAVSCMVALDPALHR